MNPDSPKLHKSYEESAQSTLLILVPKNRNNDFVYSILVVNFFYDSFSSSYIHPYLKLVYKYLY